MCKYAALHINKEGPCIDGLACGADRYFGSFPKVGIVIPNIAQWLLPELQDLAKTLQTTLQLPPDATIGHGLTLEPTGDGILISLPTGDNILTLVPCMRPSATL